MRTRDDGYIEYHRNLVTVGYGTKEEHVVVLEKEEVVLYSVACFNEAHEQCDKKECGCKCHGKEWYDKQREEYKNRKVVVPQKELSPEEARKKYQDNVNKMREEQAKKQKEKQTKI